MPSPAPRTPQPARSRAGLATAADHRRLRRDEPGFPSPLLALAGVKELYVRGGEAQLVRLGQPGRVTIVGARAASPAGLERAAAFSYELTRRGILVISGGALGIDAAAHRGALSASGATCAVLGTGIDVCYPQVHRELYASIAATGLLLSTLPLAAPPRRAHFPARNRVMAALAELVLVVESQPGSGSGHTARFARDLGRGLLAVPGSPGTDQLIAEGARAVRSADEVLALLSAAPAATGQEPAASLRAEPEVAASTDAVEPAAVLPDELGQRAAILLSCLHAQDARDVSELCARSGLSAAACAALLTELELVGCCARLPGGRYIGHAPLR